MAAKLARMGRASGYIVRAFPQGSSDFFSFSDDYKSFALRDSRPSLLNKPSQRIQTSLCSADSPFLSSPQRLLQLVHGDSLFRELLYKIANFFGVVANAVPFLSLPCTPLTNTASVFHAWALPALKQHSRDGMSLLR